VSTNGHLSLDRRELILDRLFPRGDDTRRPVLRAFRRIALGLAVVVAASAILLLSDLQHRERGPRASAASRKWKLYFVQYNDVIDVKDAQAGVMDGLAESGLRDGRDFEIKILNAQGDMATVSALIDAAVTANADMLITFSTPTLQAALRRAENVPVVYNYVASGLKAGAGKSNADHAPNVTGVSLLPANDEALSLLHNYFPNIHRLGTLYCPAETNMVNAKIALDEAAKRAGYEVVYVPAETATDVPDASAALMSRDIDAVLQIPGNLTASAFGSISEAARRAHIPIFAFQKSQAIGGAMVVVARDYKDSGRHAAHLAARIMRGELPKKIPLEDFGKTSLIVNLDAARALNVSLPPALVRSAQSVIGASSGNR
jgi:ABC-type uncharacterized transport system substrate-binding protein